MAARVRHLFLIIFLLLPFLSDQTTAKYSSFNHLEGSRKGEKRDGIQKVKQYLERYGYLKTSSSSSSSSQNPEMVDKSDEFDDVLESSLKEFQRFYHLEPTGMLDEATTSLMSKPRCGYPDKYPNNNNNNNNNNIYRPDYAFMGTIEWPNEEMHIHYHVNPGDHPEGPITRGFNLWVPVSNFTFERVREESRAVLQVTFELRDGPSGTLASAAVFSYTNALMRFDTEECWADGAVPGCYDLQTAAAHEMGHVLGLAHSQDEAALMFAVINTNQVKTLNRDDVAGIKALYPS